MTGASGEEHQEQEDEMTDFLDPEKIVIVSISCNFATVISK